MELYVHIPFCKQKCRYCAFTSFTGQEAAYEEYISLLPKEAEARMDEAREPVRTVYIGGGTPSLLPPALLRRLAEGLSSLYGFSAVEEFTSEANPGTVSAEWLDAAASAGVNRLSFGMQAYQDRLLSLLGRIHRFDSVCRSVELARKAGFANISLDLIFGIPGQSPADWCETLDKALSLAPEHVSAYGLIPEEGTPLNSDLESGQLSLPDPDSEREMYDTAISVLSALGYRQYEISSFARESRECRHNIGYWTQVPYIGLGVSAASMTGVRLGSEGMSYGRRTNPSTLDAYRSMVLGGDPPAASERIGPEEARFEALMLGLRMKRGIRSEDFLRMHRITPEQYRGEKLRRMRSLGLMEYEGGAWRMTRKGFDIQNSVLVELMDG